jgi:DNA-binding SARP family transcriptional activator
VQFNVLGALEVLDSEGRAVDVGGAQPRAVLVMLLIANDRVVPAETIIDRLWPDKAPGSASGTLQSYISRLRRVLEPKGAGESPAHARALAWEARGYRLHPDPADSIDFLRFEQLADRGRELLEAGDSRQARDVLAQALDLWRGPALSEFADHDWARGAATRLDERRSATLEDRIRADLLLGRHELVIGELTLLTDEQPLHEGFREQLAVALYRSGRQAEALRAIDDLRRQLVDHLGVDPSHRIRELETRILDHDPVLAVPPPARTTPPPVSTSTASRQVLDAQLEHVSHHIEGLVPIEVVGRESERRLLGEALEAGLGGLTQWVVLEGEPGIGKTRLLEHLAQSASQRGYQVLWGRCYESGAPPAFWLWLAALRGLVDASDPLPEPTQELIDRLLSPAADVEHTGPVDASRFRLFDAISVLLLRGATRRPLLLALDDVQWADRASLELIEYIAGTLVGAPVVIACTVRQLELARNDDVVHALAHISRRPTARRIQLKGLDAGESAELARLAVDAPLSPDVVDAHPSSLRRQPVLRRRAGAAVR